MQNYYDLLGVPQNASEEEIRKAYRKHARKLHPDIAGADGEEEFKSVSEAFDTLSNAKKRQEYDYKLQYGDSYSGFGGDFSQSFSFGGAGFEDILGAFFGGNSSSAQSRKTLKGDDLLYTITLSLENLLFGTEQKLKYRCFVSCNDCEGTGSKDKSPASECKDCRGSGVRAKIVRTMLGQMQTQVVCETCQGFGVCVLDPCSACSGEGRVVSDVEFSVKIPAGLSENNSVSVTNRGNAGRLGAESGVLHIKAKISENSLFLRDNLDLQSLLHIPMTDAALGAKVSVQTLDGEQSIDIKKGTQTGETIKLSGLGVPHFKRPDLRGDLFLTIFVETPKKLSSSEKDLLSNLQKTRSSADTAFFATIQPSLFSKIKNFFR